MANVSKEMQNQRKKLKEILEIKNSVKGMPLICSSVDWTWLRKKHQVNGMSVETPKTEKRKKGTEKVI